MGYILPITQFQYQDYKNRVIKNEQSPYFIEHPYKVVLDTKSRELEDEENTHESGYPFKNKDNYKALHIEKPTNEKLYAKLTGKGQHFSESI